MIDLLLQLLNFLAKSEDLAIQAAATGQRRFQIGDIGFELSDTVSVRHICLLSEEPTSPINEKR